MKKTTILLVLLGIGITALMLDFYRLQRKMQKEKLQRMIEIKEELKLKEYKRRKEERKKHHDSRYLSIRLPIDFEILGEGIYFKCINEGTSKEEFISNIGFYEEELYHVDDEETWLQVVSFSDISNKKGTLYLTINGKQRQWTIELNDTDNYGAINKRFEIIISDDYDKAIEFIN